MKVLIVSDTHSRHENLEKAVKLEKPFDLMVHLGDAEGCEGVIQEMAGCPLKIVAGNCDFLSGLRPEEEIQIGKYTVLITHGHYFNVNAGIEDIKKEARGRRCDFVMFGHTHRPLIDYGRDVIAINPGSLSYPRQEGRRPSYAVMKLDERGEAHFMLRYL